MTIKSPALHVIQRFEVQRSRQSGRQPRMSIAILSASLTGVPSGKIFLNLRLRG